MLSWKPVSQWDSLWYGEGPHHKAWPGNSDYVVCWPMRAEEGWISGQTHWGLTGSRGSTSSADWQIQQTTSGQLYLSARLAKTNMGLRIVPGSPNSSHYHQEITGGLLPHTPGTILEKVGMEIGDWDIIPLRVKRKGSVYVTASNEGGQSVYTLMIFRLLPDRQVLRRKTTSGIDQNKRDCVLSSSLTGSINLPSSDTWKINKKHNLCLFKYMIHKLFLKHNHSLQTEVWLHFYFIDEKEAGAYCTWGIWRQTD